jgi:hypothetical protein
VKLSQPNPQAVRVLAKTECWLLLIALIPSSIYAYTTDLLAGLRVFAVFFVVITPALIWAFWAHLYPKQAPHG